MNILFKKLILHNFMSFKDAELNFNTQGYTLVRGQNNYPDDNSTSNGSGKSALWEAISWVLTGNTIRGFKDIVNKTCDDGTFVELFFTSDSNEYHLIRSKNSAIYKTNLLIYENEIDKSAKGIRDSEKVLKDMFPDLTSQLIGSVIILGQGLPQRFTNNTPSGRKDVLEKLTKSDFMIEDLKSRVSKRDEVLKKSLREFEDTQLSTQTQISTLQGSINQLEAKLSELLSIKNKSNNLSSLKAQLDSLNQQLIPEDELNSELLKIDNLKNEINNKLSEINLQIKQLKLDLADKKQEFELNKKSVELELVQLNKQILEIQQIKTVCPTCKQKLAGVVKPDATPLISEKEKKDKILQDLILKITEISKSYDLKIAEVQKRLEQQIFSLKNTLQTATDNYNKNNSLNQKLKLSISSLEKEINNITNTISNINNQIELLTLNKKEYQDKISNLEEKLLYINNRIEETTSRLSIISKMQTALKRDFRGILLQNIIQYLDNKCKEYCNIVFNTDNIEFKLNGNDISISYNAKEYEGLSGGEKQRLDIIIQLAIRNLLCDYLNFSSNILVVDEVFDNLDLLGCNQIINLLSSQIADVSSIYIITHRGAELDIPNDHQINIIKDESGISYLNEF